MPKARTGGRETKGKIGIVRCTITSFPSIRVRSIYDVNLRCFNNNAGVEAESDHQLLVLKKEWMQTT